MKVAISATRYFMDYLKMQFATVMSRSTLTECTFVFNLVISHHPKMSKITMELSYLGKAHLGHMRLREKNSE